MLAAADLMIGLQIAIAVMVIVLLYHALFIAVDLRKILRRIEEITSQMEDVFLKPIAVIDHLFQLIVDMLEKHQGAEKKKHSVHHKKNEISKE